MIGVYIMLGGMATFATLIVVYDMVAERHQRTARRRRAAAARRGHS